MLEQTTNPPQRLSAPGEGVSAPQQGTASAELDGYFITSRGATGDHRQPQLRPVSKTPAIERSRDTTPAQRYALAQYLADAEGHARSMEEAASDADSLRLATSGVALSKTLSNLWRLRKLRDDEWGEIVNFLQGVTVNVEFENLTQEQCTSFRMIIESHLRPDVDDNDVEAVIALLGRSGFNPWKGIAEPG